MPRTSVLIIALFILGLVASCGPSLRRTYQSDNAFARCFDMDYNPGVSAPEKEECWNGWLERRLYNQREDKIRYARLRLDELADGVSVPGPPGPPGAFDKRPAPKPEDKGKTVDLKAGAASRPSADEAPPSSGCEKTCKETRKACRGACGVDAGIADNCLSACDEGYKTCMRQCFGG